MTDTDLAIGGGDDAFTPEEQAAFEAYERGDEGSLSASDSLAAPGTAPTGAEPAAAAPAAPDAAPGEIVDPETDPEAGSPEENKGKFVRHGAFHQERERRKAVEKERDELRERLHAYAEKAIREADLGLNPGNDGRLIRLVVPELNEERRRELVKVVRTIAEEGRIAIRNVRRDVMHDLRELKEGGDIGADDEHRAEVELQKLTDGQIAELDGLLKGKEAEILEV